MAFNKPVSVNFKAPTTAVKGDWERALGFINLMVPQKFGAINLMGSNPNQKALYEALAADTTGELLKNVCAQLALDFNPNGGQSLWDFMDDKEPLVSDPSKALGYINFFLPDEAGDMVQLGSVSLWAKDARDQRLFDALNESDERCGRTLKAILASLSLTFHPNKPGAVKKPGFALLKAA